MADRRKQGSTKAIRLASIVFALVACATVASAQSREGRWELSIGPLYQGSNALTFDGGSTLDTDSEWGFTSAFAYNLSDSLALNFGFQWTGVDYNAVVVRDDEGTTGISGTFDQWNTSAGLTFNFMEGPVVPYIGAGIGWMWVDTNIPNGLPTTGCWWDPWYGYICYTDYPTKTTDALSYQATAGIRFEYNPQAFVRLGYTSQWIDLDNATTTPRFDVLTLDFGWMF